MRERYLLMRAERANHAVTMMARLLGVSASGFYAWLKKGEDDDPVLKFRPSVGQGFGNTSRVRHYDFVKHGRELDHGGIMDTTVMGELTWNLGHGVSLTGYVAYSDYIFDSNMRQGARGHNAAWGHGCNHSWNFYGGVGVTFAF